jgi:hypothetical protein
MMTVRELKAALAEFPDDWFIHLDVSRPFEGDRVVRGLSDVRHQDGYNAVALDASEYDGNDVPGGIDVTIVP